MATQSDNKPLDLGKQIKIIETNISQCEIYKNYVRKTYINKYPFEKNDFMKEVTILTLLKNVVGFPKIVTLENNIIINDDDETTLHTSIVMNNLGNTLSQYDTYKERQFIFRQILERLQILHSNFIVHCDLKTNNIVIDDNKVVSIIDFSHSQLVHPISMSLQTDEEIYQTESYLAPESRSGLHKDYAIDIWSLGCIYYEMITGEYLFVENSVNEIYQNQQNDSYLSKINNLPVSSQEINLLLSMLQRSPSKRATVRELLMMSKHASRNLNDIEASILTTPLTDNRIGLTYIDLNIENKYRPIWFEVDKPISRLGYYVIDTIIALTPKLKIKQNDIQKVVFVLMHLLYYSTMNPAQDIFANGFINCIDPYTNSTRNSKDMIIASTKLLNQFFMIRQQVGEYLASFITYTK